MTLTELKRIAKSAPTTATIVSDGCRDYVIAIAKPNGAGMLQDRKRRTLKFRSLFEAKQALRRASVDEIVLSVRVAADEACAGPVPFDSGIANVSLAHHR
jgi:hypothetical protein